MATYGVKNMLSALVDIGISKHDRFYFSIWYMLLDKSTEYKKGNSSYST